MWRASLISVWYSPSYQSEFPKPLQHIQAREVGGGSQYSCKIICTESALGISASVGILYWKWHTEAILDMEFMWLHFKFLWFCWHFDHISQTGSCPKLGWKKHRYHYLEEIGRQEHLPLPAIMPTKITKALAEVTPDMFSHSSLWTSSRKQWWEMSTLV